MAAYMYVGRSWGVSAQTAGKELEKIEARNGEITPIAVVEAARPEDSVLHKCFEWNDEKAAEQYRLSQARNLIRCIVVKPESNSKTKKPIRMFVNQNPTDDGQIRQGSYINYRSAFENPDSRAVVLANAKHELQVFRSKYAQLSELSKVFSAIDETLEKAI